mmetsp:Transcript_11361/g.30048  ORF Transcript_11361/g.30048 Transcript_11361/m.30048 type:complete len:361 (-) Transcript_11361:1631-2713(-)
MSSTGPYESKRQLVSEFQSLEQEDAILAEYVWIDGSMENVRSKTRTLRSSKPITDASTLPEWNFDGSSTGQAPGHDSEVILKPVTVFKDPFRRGNNILVLCECYTPQGEALPTNTRAHAKEVFDKVAAHEPWYGLEQEYTLFDTKTNWPLGWPTNGYPGPQGPYYCSAGAENSFGRDLVEAHYRACLYAGIKVAGCNAEVMAGQWEYQVGPCEGIECGDHVWMSRYILQRVGEIFDIRVTLHPKPIKGDWNGAGLHTNYSTQAMREEGGYQVILDAIDKLSKKHDLHISKYGADNDQRLTGLHETASIDKFSYGVANRGASVRIPRTTEAEGKGYFEDRRPASNGDPYVISTLIAETTIL